MHETAGLPAYEGPPPKPYAEMKVKIDRRLYATLQAYRALRGMTIQDTVTNALVAHLDLDPTTYRPRRKTPQSTEEVAIE